MSMNAEILNVKKALTLLIMVLALKMALKGWEGVRDVCIS